MVINCEGWACTIVKDFEEQKTETTKGSAQGGKECIFNAEKKTKIENSRGSGRGMYSSEKTESRGDSPVIFVVGTNVTMVIYDDHNSHEQ